jgi:predicted transcriptional regulator
VSLHQTADTSRDAFHVHQASGKLGAQQEQILAFLRRPPHQPCTRSEIAEATGIKLSAVCGRVNELLALGDLEELPRRRCTVTTSSAHPVRLRGKQATLF